MQNYKSNNKAAGKKYAIVTGASSGIGSNSYAMDLLKPSYQCQSSIVITRDKKSCLFLIDNNS